jgi:hypothetical protein
MIECAKEPEVVKKSHDDHMMSTMKTIYQIGLLILGFWIIIILTAIFAYCAGRMSASAEVNLDPEIDLKLDPSKLKLSTENKVLLDASTIKTPNISEGGRCDCGGHIGY